MSFAARRAWAWYSSPPTLQHNNNGEGGEEQQQPATIGGIDNTHDDGIFSALGNQAQASSGQSGVTNGGLGGDSPLAQSSGGVDNAEGGAAASILVEIIEAVEDVGFGAEASPDVELLVEGMMCQKNCGTTVKNALLASSPEEVVRAEASFAEGRARVWTRRRKAARVAAKGDDRGDVAARVAGKVSEGGIGSQLINGRHAIDGNGDGGEGAGRNPGTVNGADFTTTTAAAAAAASSADARLVAVMVEALEAVGFEATLAPSAVLEIEGMMCQKSCGTTVRGCLESVPGVERAEVSYAEGRLARVWARDGPRLPVSVLVEAVEDVGFGARVVNPGEEIKTDAGKGKDEEKKKEAAAAAAAAEEMSSLGLDVKEEGAGGGVAVGVFMVSGMSCASCVGNVERFVSALEGVVDVRVALLAEKVMKVSPFVCLSVVPFLREKRANDAEGMPSEIRPNRLPSGGLCY